LKGVIASADEITARLMKRNEVTTKVNTTFFFNLNQISKCEPANGMEKARLIHSALKFGDPSSGEFNGTVRQGDPRIKEWIHNQPWLPQAMLSYVAHYYSETSAFYLPVPESFQQE
jgi:hypothetical protein